VGSGEWECMCYERLGDGGVYVSRKDGMTVDEFNMPLS